MTKSQTPSYPASLSKPRYIRTLTTDPVVSGIVGIGGIWFLKNNKKTKNGKVPGIRHCTVEIFFYKLPIPSYPQLLNWGDRILVIFAKSDRALNPVIFGIAFKTPSYPAFIENPNIVPLYPELFRIPLNFFLFFFDFFLFFIFFFGKFLFFHKPRYIRTFLISVEFAGFVKSTKKHFHND